MTSPRREVAGFTGASRLTSGGSASRGDRVFSVLVTLAAACVPLLLIAIFILLLLDALPAVQRYGLGFLASSDWDPVAEKFGAAAYIYGTVVTSVLAVLIAGPIGVACAVYVAEYAPKWLAEPVSFLITLLAAIPSIIYGLWGFRILAPIMRAAVEPFLKNTLGNVPAVGALFSGPTVGRDYLVAGVILAIMILPTITAVSREILRAVPNTQREGMLALGATRWETIQRAVLPYARSGIAGAVILGLARALGETMAVTMVIGNSSTQIRPSLFTPGYTLASAIANQFTEADKEIYFSAVVEIALVLLLVAGVMNVVARLLVWGVRGPLGSATRAG
ncbi:MAG TPA: phosphate ABC transporter permease subunit PstC [Chloroflexota bacterium]|nr:phosphate ABC transporter permease subunit PstC [Chloroflexota bacterium]